MAERRTPDDPLSPEVIQSLSGAAGDLVHIRAGEWHSPVGSHTTIHALILRRPPLTPFRSGGRVQGLVSAPPLRLPNSDLFTIIDADFSLAVQLCFSKTRRDTSQPLITAGTYFTMAKPLLVYAGSCPLLVVASPADIHILSVPVIAANPSPRALGNALFEREMYMQACVAYLDFVGGVYGTQVSASEKLARLSNRAQASLNLGLVDLAVLCAARGLDIDRGHIKCLLRKARGLAAMGEYAQALECMELAVSQNGALELRAERNQLKILSLQSSTGVYKDASPCADFVGPVEVKAGQHGRGLFLTQDVKKGELLLVSNAIAAVDSEDDSYEDLMVKLLRACRGSSKSLAQLNSLARSHDEEREVPCMKMFKPDSSWPLDEKLLGCQGCCGEEMDVWKLRKIIEFASCTLEGEGGSVKGVWGLPGFINHSCTPNVIRCGVGQAMFVRAARDLSAGEELVRSYTCSAAPWAEARKRECFTRWGFRCTCERCGVEERHEDLLKQVGWAKDIGEVGLGEVTRLEKAVKDLGEEEKRLIRCGYILAYANCSLEELGSVRGCPKAEELMAIVDEMIDGVEEGFVENRLMRFAAKLQPEMLEEEEDTLVVTLSCFGRS